MKKLNLIMVITIIGIGLQSFAGGGTVPTQKIPKACVPMTTIDGSHNQDCAPEANGDMNQNSQLAAPTIGLVQSNFVAQCGFVSSDTGQKISIALAAQPVHATWSGMIYDITYQSILALSDQNTVKVSEIIVDNKDNTVMIKLSINAKNYLVTFASTSHEIYNVFRESTRMYRLGDDGSFVETFQASLDTSVVCDRTRSGALVEVPLN